MMRQLIIRNTRTFAINVAGVVIPPLSSVDFSDFPVAELVIEPNLDSNLTIGDLVISDGTQDLTVGDAQSYLLSFNTNQGVNNTIIGGDIISNDMVFFQDTSRGNKILSIESVNYNWNDQLIKPNDWMGIGDANDAEASHVMPFDGAITRMTWWTEKVVKLGDILLYINNVSSILQTFTLLGPNQQMVNTALNIDFFKNDRLRLRANPVLQLADTVIDIGIKWRRI